MKLKSNTISVSELTDKQVNCMYDLMKEHYCNVFFQDFKRDLEEKNTVFMLYNLTNEIIGFSTLQYFDFTVNNNPSIVMFSGDTIIHRNYWGSLELPLAFTKFALELLDKFPNKKLYWFLISKGVRTYKYLSVFMKIFYPNVNREMPDYIKKAISELAKLKFSGSFIPEKGILRADEKSQFLKLEFQPDKIPNNPHIQYYYKINPGYYKGDELLCFSEFTIENLSDYFRNIILKEIYK